MNRFAASSLAFLFLLAEFCHPLATVRGESNAQAASSAAAMDLFDAIKSGAVEAKFVARDSNRGRIVMENKTDQPVLVEIPEAFIGVPLAQFGGGGFGGGGLGGGGGGLGGGQQQNVGGGGGRGGGGGGRGGGGRGGGFNIPPEKTVRIDVPLLCLDHGKREPSSSKPYAILPIENVINDPAVIEVVASYANGDLPTDAAQAAVWNLNSGVSWDELSAKLTGTKRSVVREPYFSGDEIQAAMAIVAHAQRATAGQKVTPRDFPMPGEKASMQKMDEVASPGDEAPHDETSPRESKSPVNGKVTKPADDSSATPRSEAKAA